MVRSSLPKYNLPDLSGSYLNQVGQFEDILENAKLEGIVNYTPNDAIDTYNTVGQSIRIHTIATRLWLLGYLPRKFSQKTIKDKIDEIKSAVLKFQKDANLRQDDWVGDKTWYALDELVSFESDLTYSKWFTNGQIKSEVKNSFHRAIQLRLWSLGLYKNKPKANSNILNTNDLLNFEGVLKIFLIKNASYKSSFDYETIRLLFNQDLLTKAIADRTSKNKKTFLLRLPSKKKFRNRVLAQKFIVNCAKIELWLIGYSVKIDGVNNFKLTNNSDIYNAVLDFHRNFLSTNVNYNSVKITPDLFIKIESVNNINYEKSEEASQEILESLKTDEDVNNAWAYIKNKGVRLWDGLKRLWKWFKQTGNKILTFLKDNVFKAFYRYTSKAYKIVKRGIYDVVKSLGVYISGILKVDNIIYLFSKDMDTLVLLPSGINQSSTTKGINSLLKQSKAFKIGCEIIALIFKIFKNIVTGYIGWAKLLISLLMGYKDLLKLYKSFKSLSAT